MAVLFHCPWENADEWLSALRKAMPREEFRVWPELGNIVDIDFALVWNLPPGELRRLPNLVGVSSLGAGVDAILNDSTLPPGLPVARLVDPLMAERMAEYVSGCVLYYHLNHDAYDRQQRQRRWQRLECKDARDRTVGILGLGHLGTAVAHKLRGLGFRLCGWSRHAKELDGIECFHGEMEFERMLEQCEILVTLLPLTPATEGLLDKRVFNQMPGGAFLINCARGQLLVEQDLIAALDAGRLAGATLDVFNTEPLPAEHPFWVHPRVRITPHVSCLSEPTTGALILADQIRRVRRGGRMHDVVDPRQGY